MIGALAPAEEEVLGALRRAYRHPTAGGRRPRLTDLVKLAEGWECDVYSFHATGEGSEEAAGKRRILKLFLGAGVDAKCQRECRVLRFLPRVGIPVPAVLGAGPASSPFGKPFVILEESAGELLGDVFMRANAARRGELVSLFCALLVRLHAVAWEPLLDEPLPFAAGDPFGYLTFCLGEAEEKIQRFAKQEFLPLLEWLRGRLAEVPCPRLSLLHGDYHDSNVLLSAAGAPAILDWTGSGIGDFRRDLATTLLLVDHRGFSQLRQAVLAEYERIARKPVDHLEFFDVLAMTQRLLNISCLLDQGGASLGLRPGVEVKIREDCEHVTALASQLRERTGISLPELDRRLKDPAA